MVTDYPWLLVSGFGVHIKSTQKKLIIQKKNTVEEYPLDSIKNLLVMGGHTINSSTIVNLVKNGAFISFFEPDGNPIGIIRPFGDRNDTEIHRIQQGIPRQRYAIALAQTAIKSRLFAIQCVQENQNTHLFYEAEQEFLHKAQEELQYLIKLDEIQRLHRLTTDMYYEIMSQNTPRISDSGGERYDLSQIQSTQCFHLGTRCCLVIVVSLLSEPDWTRIQA